MHKIGVRAVKNLKPLIKTRCLSYVPIDDRFFGLSDEEIELRGMTLKFEVHTSSCLKSDSVVRHKPSTGRGPNFVDGVLKYIKSKKSNISEILRNRNSERIGEEN